MNEVVIDPQDISEFIELAKSEWHIDLQSQPNEYIVDQIERFVRFGQLTLKEPLELTNNSEENLIEDEC